MKIKKTINKQKLSIKKNSKNLKSIIGCRSPLFNDVFGRHRTSFDT